MDAPHSLTQSIYEWLQTSTPSGGQGDGYTREGFFDTTFSQPMDKPPNKLMPTNADIITPSPRSCLLDDHHQDISDGAPHNLAQQTEDPKGAAGDQTELSHNPYARRLRRKTKEDKYEVKEGPARRCHREVGAKEAVKEKKRKRQETSGAALLHRYNADNVASDRLTVSGIISSHTYFGRILLKCMIRSVIITQSFSGFDEDVLIKLITLIVAAYIKAGIVW